MVQPVGVAHVEAQYGQQRAELPIYITKEKGPPLLGRQWLQAIRLNWHRIFGLNRAAISVKMNFISYGFGSVYNTQKRNI
ncbi:hypothetical protein IscW_ISCW008496 [Ixodes scapularis]|uniref:Uncharacterized protein n=1 Tax=Ixodes scapularis TaxID=6945 RepID=B7Q0J8_IXOSC|nr:hypothetical protein IscW_ISCW008496 [Ixodes scapularis]|eukprot:XP_002407916.1 hypothetical protein IscW_ISCW008496 [Ixodes scapularis]